MRMSRFSSDGLWYVTVQWRLRMLLKKENKFTQSGQALLHFLQWGIGALGRKLEPYAVMSSKSGAHNNQNNPIKTQCMYIIYQAVIPCLLNTFHRHQLLLLKQHKSHLMPIPICRSCYTTYICSLHKLMVPSARINKQLGNKIVRTSAIGCTQTRTVKQCLVQRRLYPTKQVQLPRDGLISSPTSHHSSRLLAFIIVIKAKASLESSTREYAEGRAPSIEVSESDSATLGLGFGRYMALHRRANSAATASRTPLKMRRLSTGSK